MSGLLPGKISTTAIHVLLRSFGLQTDVGRSERRSERGEIREVELPEEEEMKEEEVDMDEKKDAEEEKEEKKDKYDEIVFSTRKTRKFEVKINQVFFFFRF